MASSPLITIPNVTLLHVPAPNAVPITLAQGELSLAVLEGQEKPTLVLSVDHATFPITSSTPITPTDTTQAHSSYAFVPASLKSSTSEGGIRGLGKVKIVFKQSSSAGEYEALAALAKKFEEILHEKKVWKDKGYYDDEDEAARASPAEAGYGTTIADTLTKYANLFSAKITELTEQNIKSTPGGNIGTPSDNLKSAAASTESFTKQVSEFTHTAAEIISNAVHDGGKFVGGYVNQTAKDLSGPPVSDAEKGEVRREVEQTAQGVKEMAEAGWEEVKIAGEGAKNASITAGSSISQNAHKEIEHNYGPQADALAKDVGSASFNVTSAGSDAAMQTMGYVHGANAAMGASKGLQGQ